MTNDSDWALLPYLTPFSRPTDQILLLLGPNETPYPFLLVDVPEFSEVLVAYAELPPRERVLRLPTISTDMMDAYIELHCGYEDITDVTWEGEIKLAITGEVLKDRITKGLAIGTLRMMVDGVQRGVREAFTRADYSIAKKYRHETGGGRRLLEILKGASVPVWVVTKDSDDIKNETAPEDTDKGISLLEVEAEEFSIKYANSALRNMRLWMTKQDENYKWYPICQPVDVPDIQTLLSGAVKNFAWPI
ncbi:hypothetical protein HBH53_203800 [Parastagonospora nodorum]|nr:hypothetical protein HBH53_203800 [Parastagonospora nodorum]KAH4058816.1 hypothetical protein HBH50_231670 [Parastagonospora nodorum]KAH4078912.1 hypothetical protein HBH48_225140 [Parastagonospora nodorum]KAH4113886.1 hypothetical protein HBH47_204900 [Parastagonospora nodorum]KAH5195235.1 hypothetical protein HBH77_143220 [Parastagonospora nodorum]